MKHGMMKIYGNSVVTKSKAFDEIIKIYSMLGDRMPMTTFWKRYVKKHDPSISVDAWRRFIKKYTKVQEEKNASITQFIKAPVGTPVPEKKGNYDDFFNSMMFIVDYTIDEMRVNPQLISRIPIKDRLNLVFRVFAAREAMRKNDGEKDKKKTLMDQFLSAAQYGEIGSADIDSGEGLSVSDDDQSAVQAEESVETGESKEIKFNPEDLDNGQ